MPKDDPGQVFDVSRPNKVGPDPTSKPIIVGHQPMMSDPMVRDQNVPEAPMTPTPPIATMEHKAIPITTPDDNPQPTTPAPKEPASENHDKSSDAPAIAVPVVTPEHPESVKAAAPVGPLSDQATQATTPPGDLHLMPVDDLIGHNHHNNTHHGAHNPVHAAQLHEPDTPAPTQNKSSKTSLWVLIGLIVVAIAVYLAIDSRLIKTSINLPFHIFKQPDSSQSAY